MIKMKKVIATLAVAAITLGGACANPISNIPFSSSSIMHVSAINYDATISYENQYGTWTFCVDKGASGKKFVDATLCVRRFTPKDPTFCSYASIPSTVSGTITQYGKKYSVSNLKVTWINCNAFKNSIIESLYIPGSVEGIGIGAFEGCKKLTTVSIGNNSKLWLLQGENFRGCTSLKNISLPNSLTNMSSGVFEGCSSLTYMNIPSSVKAINTRTFANCTSLRTINCSLTKTAISGTPFIGCTNLKTINAKTIMINNEINPELAPYITKANFGK